MSSQIPKEKSSNSQISENQQNLMESSRKYKGLYISSNFGQICPQKIKNRTKPLYGDIYIFKTIHKNTVILRSKEFSIKDEVMVWFRSTVVPISFL